MTNHAPPKTPSLRVCIGSDYNDGLYIYNGLCYEACTAIAGMTGATVIAPQTSSGKPVQRLTSLAHQSLTGYRKPIFQRHTITDDYDLFIHIGMQPSSLRYLSAMKDWRDRSRRAVAFLFETWSAKAHRHRRHLRLLDNFDHVFLFNPRSVKAVQAYTSAPCSYLPAAVDVLSPSPFPRPVQRAIDIYSMGRTVPAVHEQLLEMTREKRLLYIWEPGAKDTAVNGFAEARFRTYHLIRNSRYFTSFSFRSAPKKAKDESGEEAIPARVFEGAAGGAVMIGSAPKSPEFEQLFDWPDALIEMPMDPVDMRTFYAELEADPLRIQRASLLNTAQSMRRHDWAHRMEEILRTLDLPIPAGVVDRRVQLEALAKLVEAQL